MENRLRISDSRISIVPKALLSYEVFKNLDILHRNLPNDDLIILANEVNHNPLSYIIKLYLDIVNYTSTEEEKHYIMKRLIAMKSVEKVLWELEKYTNIVYNVSLDTPSLTLLKTRYKPNLLKVTILSIETDQPDTILETLESLFAALLYYKELDFSIIELVIRLNIDLQLDSQSTLISGFNITNLLDWEA